MKRLSLRNTTAEIAALAVMAVVFGGVLAGPAGAQEKRVPSWMTSLIDDFSDRFMDIETDRGGRVHIAYVQGETLFHGSWDGEDWVTQYVDTVPEVHSPGSSWLDMALDSNGLPHIVYANRDRSDLRCARWDGVALWTIETIDAADGANPRIKLDALDSPHVVYSAVGGAGSNLKHATRPGASWVTAFIPGADARFPQKFADIAMGPDGVLHLVYSAFADNRMMHAVFSSGSWTALPVESVLLQRAVQIEVDAAGFVHILYGRSDALALESASRPPGANEWNLETVDEDAVIADSSPLGLITDAFRRVHVVYGSDLNYACLGRGGWQKTEIDGTVIDARIAADRSGRPHVIFGVDDFNLRRIGYATPCTEWSGPELVSPNRGSQAMIDADSEGRVHAVFSDAGLFMQYGVREDGVWQLESFPDFTLLFGTLAVDSQGRVHVVGKSGTAVNYYRRDNGSWLTEEIVEFTGSFALGDNDSARYSLAIDSSDEPHVSFVNENQVKYAKRAGAGIWVIDTVETVNTSVQSMRQTSDITLDGADRPHLSYVKQDDFPDTVVRYAHNPGGSWTIVDAAPTFSSSRHTAVELDSAGDPHVIFLSGFLQHATKPAGGSWVVDILDVRGLAAPFDMERDIHGRLQFAYLSRIEFAANDDIVRRGRLIGKRWFFDTVERGVSYSSDSALSLDPFGNAHCLYPRDSTGWPQGEGKLAYRFENEFAPTFADWSVQQFTEAERMDASVSGPLAAPAGDGLPNLVKHLVGEPAGDPFFSPFRSFVTREGKAGIAFHYIAAASDVGWEVQVSPGMGEWTPIARWSKATGIVALESCEIVESGIGLCRSVLVTDNAGVTDGALEAFIRLVAVQE